jgi:iron complex transport system substrate-binding protein
MSYPSRIVCLTEETTETLYLLGEGDRVVGISGYTVRPPEARQKPKVSSFLHARYEKIEALKPDLILAFSDLQAEITNDLVKRGYPVFTFNHAASPDLQMIRVLAGIVGVPERPALATVRADLDDCERAAALPRRPKVFFEW